MSATRSAPSTGAHNPAGVQAIRALANRIRTHALHMTSLGGGSHIGAIFSCVDILAVLYGHILNVDPADPKSPTRDRFVLSKGHACAGLYAALAERGFLNVERFATITRTVPTCVGTPPTR